MLVTVHLFNKSYTRCFKHYTHDAHTWCFRYLSLKPRTAKYIDQSSFTDHPIAHSVFGILSFVQRQPLNPSRKPPIGPHSCKQCESRLWKKSLQCVVLVWHKVIIDSALDRGAMWTGAEDSIGSDRWNCRKVTSSQQTDRVLQPILTDSLLAVPQPFFPLHPWSSGKRLSYFSSELHQIISSIAVCHRQLPCAVTFSAELRNDLFLCQSAKGDFLILHSPTVENTILLSIFFNGSNI